MQNISRTKRSPFTQHHGLVRWVIVAALLVALPACDYFISADTRTERARAGMHTGNYRQAMTELQKALSQHPEHIAARLQLAELSMQIGDLAAAQKELERAQSAGAADTLVYPLRYRLLEAQRHFEEMLKMLDSDHISSPVDQAILKSQAQAGLGHYDEAELSAAQAEQLSPSEPHALLQHARVYAARGNLDQALAKAGAVSQPDDVLAQAMALRGAILLNQGELAKARDLFVQARDLGKKSLSVPEQVMIWSRLADVQLALRDVEGANASVAAIAVWTPQSVLVHYLRGRIALMKNDYSTAVAESQRALQLDPAHIPAQLMLAAANLGKGSVEQAQGALEQLLAKNPNNVAGRKLLAQVYLAKKRPEEARRVLGELPDSARDDAQVDWLMGAALTQAGDTASGLEYLERSAAANPDDNDRHMTLAAAQLAAGNRDAALKTLQALPAAEGQSARKQQLLLAAIVSGRSPAEARQEIDRLVAAADTDAQLLSVAGAYLVSVGDMQRANELLQRAVARDPKAVPPHMTLAMLAARQSDFDAAEKQLNTAVALDSKYEPAYLSLAELALRRGDHPKAKQWLEQAIGLIPTAIRARLGLARLAFADSDPARGRDLLTQAVSVSQDQAAVLNAAGEVLAQVGLYEEALTKFTTASAAGSAQGALNAARVHLELGRTEQARQSLETALKLQPGWMAAQRLLVQLDVRDGHFDAAIARVRTATQQAGGNAATAAQNEGDVQMLAKRFGAAVTSYETAWRAQPSATLGVKLFRAQAAAGRKPAEDSVIAWLKKASADPAAHEILAQYYQQTGRSADAVTEYERLTKGGAADDPVLLNNLAWLYQEAGDKRAEAVARRAYELAPQSAAIADTFGWVLVQSDKVPEGLKALETAHNASPGDGNIAYHLAVAYDRSGARDRAIGLLDTALGSATPFASRTQAETLRQSLGAHR
jgi:putative PEP-CTERM system TPR-repeat lipoprotein